MADVPGPAAIEEVGLRLRRARQDQGWSLAEAASASSGRFKASTLAAYERGERRATAEAVYALAQLYRTPIARLFPPGATEGMADDDLLLQIGRLPAAHRDLVISLVERMLLDTRRPASPAE